jgi:hypothetical protein
VVLFSILEIPIFKTRKNIVKTIAPNLNEDLGKKMHIKKLKQNRWWFL